MTAAQQKTRIISGVGPMLISGVSLGKFHGHISLKFILLSKSSKNTSGVVLMLISGASPGKFYDDLHDQKTTGLMIT